VRRVKRIEGEGERGKQQEEMTYRFRLWRGSRHVHPGALQQSLERVLFKAAGLEPAPQIHDLAMRDRLANGRLDERRLVCRFLGCWWRLSPLGQAFHDGRRHGEQDHGGCVEPCYDSKLPLAVFWIMICGMAYKPRIDAVIGAAGLFPLVSRPCQPSPADNSPHGSPRTEVPARKRPKSRPFKKK